MPTISRTPAQHSAYLAVVEQLHFLHSSAKGGQKHNVVLLNRGEVLSTVLLINKPKA